LTVAENLQMGLLVRDKGPQTLDRVLNLFPALKELLRQRAGTLSGGQQQMLAMARALCLEPKLLLLDEPSEGLMPRLVEKLLNSIVELKVHGVAVLLVEQKIEAALKVADRITFLENGSVRGEATPDDLAFNPQPLLRYVGVRR
jgi:branched-chain amino acid transport system ATP-binding protein